MREVTADQAVLLARAVLLFHAGGSWTNERRAHWRALTGSTDATTRTLCDFARSVEGGLISLNQAAAAGIRRVREPQWASRFDHFELDVVDERPGPWVRLFSPSNRCFNGRDPQTLFAQAAPIKPHDAPVFLPYRGPLPDSLEYRAQAERFDRAMLPDDQAEGDVRG